MGLRLRDHEGKLFKQPTDYERIPHGLEQEASRALNAVPLTAVVTVDPFYGEICVNGRSSRALHVFALHTSVNYTLDLLAANGRAVTVWREEEDDNDN